MKRSILSVATTLLVVLLVSGAQAALTVMYVSRGVEAYSWFGSNLDSDCCASEGNFFSSVVDNLPSYTAGATQDTTIDSAALHIFGEGGTFIDGFGIIGIGALVAEDFNDPDPFPVAKSFFDVFFDLDQSYFYSLTGDLNAFVEVGDLSVANLFLRRLDVPAPADVIAAYSQLDPMPINQAGVLPAGSYFLSLLADSETDSQTGNGFAQAGYEFNLQLRSVPGNGGVIPVPGNGGVIPEPVTAGLSLLGLSGAGLTALRRRR